MATRHVAASSAAVLRAAAVSAKGSTGSVAANHLGGRTTGRAAASLRGCHRPGFCSTAATFSPTFAPSCRSSSSSSKPALASPSHGRAAGAGSRSSCSSIVRPHSPLLPGPGVSSTSSILMRRCFAAKASGATATPPASAGSASSSSQTPPNGQSRAWRYGMWLLKGTVFGIPAALFWTSLLGNTPLIDLRTDEEIQEDENEARRLERFFDVEGMPEAEYLLAWAAKDEALATLVDKLLRSRRMLDALQLGPEELDAEVRLADRPVKKSALTTIEAENLAAAVEVSYVLPAPEAPGQFVIEDPEGKPRQWNPRLIFAHQGGGLVLVSLVFHYVGKTKDREERWTCAAVHSDVIALNGGEHIGEPICDLEGPLPHGIQYMRL